MNKSELIDVVAKNADLTKVKAGEAVNAVIAAISGSLKKGGAVTLVGFGTFSVAKRAARVGRNPQTGKELKIKAKKVAKFRPGKDLRGMVNSGK